jgi:CO/xanthine dehydrogenase Mo-binding subunit
MTEHSVPREPRRYIGHYQRRIVRLDTARAEALPGVLTYADPEDAALKPTTNAWTSMDTAGYRQMHWPSLCDRRVLSDHVTWVGDEAGAVVAVESEEIAEEALRLLEVEWETLPFALSPEDALAESAPPSSTWRSTRRAISSPMPGLHPCGF